MSIKTRLARKAVGKTAKHTARGTASKLRRDRLRNSTLFVLGCAVGVAVGWVARSRPPEVVSSS